MKPKLPYLAGAIDYHANIYWEEKSQRLTLRFRTTDKKLPEFLKENFGGSVFVHTRDQSPDRMVYEVTSVKALALLKAVKPFLIAKRSFVQSIIKHSKTL